MARNVISNWAGLAIAVCLLGAANASFDSPAQTDVKRLAEGLSDSGVEARRTAAKAVFEADKSVRLALLPQISEMLRTDKDGQVRLCLFDIVTGLGPEAEQAVPALLHSLRTNFGGSRTEKLHQDYRAAIALAAIGKPAATGLRELLADPATKVNVRAETMMALGRIGKDAEVAIPELLTFLGHSDARLREEAIVALGSIGAAALEPLTEKARDAEPRTRVDAIDALGRSLTQDPKVVSILITSTEDPSADLRVAAFRALGRIGLTNERLLPLVQRGLQDDQEEVVRAAVDLIMVQRHPLLRQTLPYLMRIIQDGDSVSARRAAFAVAESGEDALPLLLDALAAPESPVELIAESLVLLGREATPRLERELDSPNSRTRRGAALALGAIRPLSAETPNKLAEGLDDADPEVRGAFLKALGDIGPRARSVVSQIRRLLNDTNAATRAQAVNVLFLCSARDDLLLNDLIGRLSDSDSSVQIAALDRLRALGPLSRKALPEVTARLESDDDDVRRSAAELIASHGQGAAEAVPSLVRLLDRPEPENWVLAIKTLARIGRPSQSAYGRLEPLMASEHDNVREAVFQAIGSMGLEADTVRPGLARGLSDKESNVRLAAMQSVQRLGPQGVLLLPDLIRVAADPKELRSVERALRRFERRGPDMRSMPELIALLGHDQEAVQLLAIRFLALAQPIPDEAIAAIERLLDHSSETVRKKAEEALQKIRKPGGPDTPAAKSGNAA